MKQILLALMFVTLAGCGLLANTYDNNEYEMLVDFTVTAEETMASCISEDKRELLDNMEELDAKSKRFELYTRYTPSNTDVHLVAVILSNDMDQMQSFYKHNDHNEIYCSRKLSMIIDKADAMLKVIPTKKK